MRPGHKSALIPTPILGAADMGALLNLHPYGIIPERVFIASSRDLFRIRRPFWPRCRGRSGRMRSQCFATITECISGFLAVRWNTKRGGVTGKNDDKIRALSPQ